VQIKARQAAHAIGRREDLYKEFIEEASKLYAGAFEHHEADLSALVRLYARVCRMRVRSSPPIFELADRVTRAIVEAYLGPKRTLRDVPEIVKSGALDALRDFSDACREELRIHGDADASC
jgi:hypothetical protein